MRTASVCMNILIVCLFVYLLYLLYIRNKAYIHDKCYPLTHGTWENFSLAVPRHPIIDRLRERLKDVHPIIETLQIREGDKSYTLNKDKVYLCLTDKDTGQIYDDNMLTYVFLHELAHVLNTKDVGHTPAFDAKFQELLDAATRKGLFDPSKPLIQNYCE